MKISFNSQASNEFIISLGLLLSGSVILIFSKYFFYGYIDRLLFYYSFLVYFFLRILQILDNLITNYNKNPLLGFSYSLLILVISISIFGFFNVSIPVKIITVISILEIIFSLYKKKIFKKKIKLFSIGFFFGLFLIFFSTFNTYTNIILEDLIHLGINFPDTLRDAAVANSWHKYSSISHGIHGLLFEPYHFFFAIFSKPFINNEFNIFDVFSFYSYLLVPSLSFYLLSKLIKLVGNDYFIKNSTIISILFILTFYKFDYVISQRSFLISSLLMISFISIFYNELVKNSSDINKVLIFGFISLLMIFARAHHGLFVCGFLFYFFLVSNKNTVKIIYLLFFIVSILIIYFFYGSTQANVGQPFVGYLKYFYKGDTYINSMIVPILIFIIFLVYDKKILLEYFFLKKKGGFNKKIKFLLFFLCSFSIILIFRPFNKSDVFYTMAPIYFFCFFILTSKKVSEVFISSNNLNKILKQNIIKNTSIFIFIVIIMSTILNVSQDFYKNSISIIKQLRIINNQWNYDGNNRYFIDINEKETNICTNNFDYFCNLRKKILSIENFKDLKKQSLPFKINKKVNEITKNLKGNSAVYIYPQNDYWSYFNSSYHFSASLYLMSMSKIPLIFGAHPDDTGLSYGKETRYGYSIETAHRNQGTLRNLKEIGNNQAICDLARIVKVKNIIVFKKEDIIERIIICND